MSRRRRAALPAWRDVSVIERGRRLFALREGLDRRREDSWPARVTRDRRDVPTPPTEVAAWSRWSSPPPRADHDAGPGARRRRPRRRRRDDPPASQCLCGDRPVQLPGDGAVLVPPLRDRLRQHLRAQAVRAGADDPVARLRVARGVGLPPGVVDLVNGGREVVEGFLEHPGSTRLLRRLGPVARIVYERAAPAGKRVQALGGAKDHMVMPDAMVGRPSTGCSASPFGAAGQRYMAGLVVVTVGAAHDAVVASWSRRPSGSRSATGSREGRRRSGDLGTALDRIVDAIRHAVETDGPLVDGRDQRRPRARGEGGSSSGRPSSTTSVPTTRSSARRSSGRSWPWSTSTPLRRRSKSATRAGSATVSRSSPSRPRRPQVPPRCRGGNGRGQYRGRRSSRLLPVLRLEGLLPRRCRPRPRRRSSSSPARPSPAAPSRAAPQRQLLRRALQQPRFSVSPLRDDEAAEQPGRSRAGATQGAEHNQPMKPVEAAATWAGRGVARSFQPTFLEVQQPQALTLVGGIRLIVSGEAPVPASPSVDHRSQLEPGAVPK